MLVTLLTLHLAWSCRSKKPPTKLDKSVRQVRYLVKLGKSCCSRKVAGRWLVTIPATNATLPGEDAAVPSPHRMAQQRKQAALRAAVEDALELPPPQRRYSLRDLKAFQVGQPLYQQALTLLGPDHARVGRRVRPWSFCHAAIGLTVPTRPKRIGRRAHAASRAVCELLLLPASGSDVLVDGIEQDLMAALAGL